MSDAVNKVEGVVPALQDAAPSEPHGPEEVPGQPREDGLEDDASCWGSPWSAVEAGWDGEEPYQPKSQGQDGEEPYQPKSQGQDGEEPYQPKSQGQDGEEPYQPKSQGQDGEEPYQPSSGNRDGEEAVGSSAESGAETQADGAEGPPPPPAATGSTAPATPEASGGGSSPPPEERPMTLMEHLGELRVRLVRCCIGVGLAFCLTYSFAEELFRALCQPVVNALPPGSKLIFTALPEAFFVHLQVGLVAAIFVACPYIFYQIWCFISPGLYEEEKKYMLPIAGFSALFFITGAAFCYFIVFPFAFTFFMGYASESIAAMPSLKEYLGFALKLLIAFGLIFEMPLFAFFLARMGVITATMMRSVRRYAVLVIFIVAAILTPPDVISQLLMAMPMLVLYEFSIAVAAAFGKKPKKDMAEETEEKSAAKEEESPAA